MANGSYEDALRFWTERRMPILVRPVTGKLKVRFPKDEIIWPLVVEARNHSPKLIFFKKYWEVARARFNKLIPALLTRWGSICVIQHFVEQKRCAPACRKAEGFDCECACGGEFHGVDGPPGKWIDISETFSVDRGESYLSCRVLTKRSS